MLRLGAWLPLMLVTLGAQTLAPLPSASELKKMSVEQLMDIEVSSVSRHPERLFDTASAIQVVTADDVRRAGARRLPEALRLAANLEVAQIDSRQWAITARGFNNVFADKMLVLIDGRTIYTPLYAGVYWDVQDTPLEDLDRIEVISGPGATQWGANAVNGVISITTKSARETQGGFVAVGGGDGLQSEATVRYGGQAAPNVYYRIYGKGFDRGPSRRIDGRDADDEWRMSQGGFRIDWEPDADVAATLQGDIYTGSFGRAGPADISARGANLLGRWTRRLDGGAELKIQTYYDRSFRAIPGSFTQTLNAYDLDVQHRFRLGERHEFTWGGTVHVVDDDIINTPANAFVPAQVTRGWYGAFGQDEFWLVPDRWRLVAGAKLEHNPYTGLEFEPSVRLAWLPESGRMFWAALSRAVRTPSRIDRELYSPATPPYRIAGGPGVVSEKLRAAELGVRQEFGPRLGATLSAFVHEYDDLRDIEPVNPPQPYPVERSSGLRGRTSGLEATLEWRVTSAWRLRGGYTELRVHTEPQGGSVPSSGDRNIARDPNHQFVLRSLLDLAPGWELDATLRDVGHIASTDVPAYTELDLRLGWNPTPAWSVSVVGRNLLHAQHAEFNARGNRREIPRSFDGQLTWRF